MKQIFTLTAIILLPLLSFAQWSITTTSGGSLVGRIENINEGEIVFFIDDSSALVPFQSIRKIDKLGYNETFEDAISLSSGSEIKCEIWGIANFRAYYSNQSGGFNFIPLNETSYIQSDTLFFNNNFSSTTLNYIEPKTIDEFQMVSSAGSKIKSSVVLRVLSLCAVTLAGLTYTTEPTAALVIGGIGVVCSVASLINEYKAGDDLEKANNIHKSKSAKK